MSHSTNKPKPKICQKICAGTPGGNKKRGVILGFHSQNIFTLVEKGVKEMIICIAKYK